MNSIGSALDNTRKYIQRFGPGVIWGVAATGSGELIIASKVGAEYGLMFVWALWLGIWLKFWIQKGILDLTLRTNVPVVELWNESRFGTYSSLYWLTFFILTATGVAGLIGLCASILAALIPALGVKVASVIVTAAIIGITFRGSYKVFERSMLFLALILGVGIITTVILSGPSVGSFVTWSIPTTAAAALVFLSLLGWGAGSGPDLMLPYSWWVNEKKTQSPEWKAHATHDLLWGYSLAGVVATVFMVAGTMILKPLGVTVEGVGVLVSISSIFTQTFGEWSFFFFMIPAFAAIFSTALGVFDGGRIALVHILRMLLGKNTVQATEYRTHRWYQIGLLAFSIVPLILFLGVPRPVFLVVIAGALSAISMPLLAFQVYRGLHKTDGVSSTKIFGGFYKINLIAAIIIYVFFTGQALWKLLVV